MDPQRIQAILEKHIPPTAVAYCMRLWTESPFEFKLRKSRVSKVGDFICHPGRVPRITINQDIHPYQFLLTYIHEFAHLHVHRHWTSRREAHGEEWKDSFRQFLAPLLTEEFFPPELLGVLKKHMINPKASSYSDMALTEALRKYDESKQSTTLLSQIPEGSLFGIRGRWFTKGTLKRTRVVCRELKSKRTYLVPLHAPVDGAQLTLI